MAPPELQRRPATRRRHGGLTILECLLASAILSIAGVSTAFVLSAGRARFDYSDKTLRCTRLAEQLLEELSARPYHGSGASRPTWCLDDYDGLVEAPGTLIDALGTRCPDADQPYRRTARIETSSIALADLGGLVVPGKQATVRVEAGNGDAREISRFIGEPLP